MEQSLADLLGDAFAETSAPQFTDEELDFEDLNFETDSSYENLQTKEDEALQQEVTSKTAEDVNMAEIDDKHQSDEDDYKALRLNSTENTGEDDYTSSEGQSEEERSGDDEEDEEQDMVAGETAVNLLMLAGNEEDRMYAEGRLLAPQGAEKPQDRNRERGESDEEVSYFEKVPERGSEMGIKGEGIEDEEEEIEVAEQEDSSDSGSEGMKVEQEENDPPLYFEEVVENPGIDSQEKVSLEFPEISMQNLHDFVAEVECEGIVEDFSGEEHEEAGESFADYPSDFSSCEYVEESQGITHQTRVSASDGSDLNTDACLEGVGTDRGSMGRGEDTDEEADEYLYSRNLDDEFGGPDIEDRERLEIVEGDEGKTDESDSCRSSEDEEELTKSDEEQDTHRDICGIQVSEHNKEYEEVDVDAAGLNFSWTLDVSPPNPLHREELLTTDDTHTAEALLSDVTAENVNLYSVVQRDDTKTTSSSSQGCLDDDFFNTEIETSRVTDLEQRGEDEYEEERSWEQEQERIKAFYRFYNDSDGEDGREGRQAKVQFCSDPLSRVIHYESDSDRDSISSSTDGEEGLSSAETSEDLREPEKEITEIKPYCDLPNPELLEDFPDIKAAPTTTRKQKCLSMLKGTLKMALVILLGLVMFWLVTDQGDMFSTGSFF